VLEYDAVKRFYGKRRAQRSGVLLMNHIDEGLVVLDEINASRLAKRAFCLHPLVQADGDLVKTFDSNSDLSGLDPRAVLLAMEYRWVANNYLSDQPSRPPQEIQLSPLKDVNDMLIADKIQNYKDFLIYHLDSHPRSTRLDQYFRQWLERLGISKERFQEIGKLLKAISPLLADEAVD
jgi:hypothetical protein